MTASDDLYVICITSAAAPLAWKSAHPFYQTAVFDEAGRYSRDEALRICQGELPRAINAGRITAVPVRLADMEQLFSTAGASSSARTV